MRVVSDLEQELGRQVLLVAGLNDTQSRPHAVMPEGFTSTDYHGLDTSDDQRLLAFHSSVPDAAILLALTFAVGRFSGTGPHVEYTAPGQPTQDLMSRQPRSLTKPGKVFFVDGRGWEADDSQVAEKPWLGESLFYRSPHEDADQIAVLGAAIVSHEDLALPVRYVQHPRLEYPKIQA